MRTFVDVNGAMRGKTVKEPEAAVANRVARRGEPGMRGAFRKVGWIEGRGRRGARSAKGRGVEGGQGREGFVAGKAK